MKMTKYLLLIYLILIGCQSSEKIDLVKNYYKSINTYDKLELEKLLSDNFNGYIYNYSSIDKETLLGNLDFNKTFNHRIYLDEVLHETDSSVTVIEHVEDDFMKMTGLEQYDLKNTFTVRDGKIISFHQKIIPGFKDEINNYYKELLRFNNWLETKYFMEIDNKVIMSNEEIKVLIKEYTKEIYKKR